MPDNVFNDEVVNYYKKAMPVLIEFLKEIVIDPQSVEWYTYNAFNIMVKLAYADLIIKPVIKDDEHTGTSNGETL